MEEETAVEERGGDGEGDDGVGQGGGAAIVDMGVVVKIDVNVTIEQLAKDVDLPKGFVDEE